MAAKAKPEPISAKHLESLSPEDRINALLALFEQSEKRITSQFIESECKLKSVTVLSPTTAKATFTFTVSRFYCNSSGNLHGGAASTIFDVCTSLALTAIGKQDFWLNAGVSRVLTVNYLRPAPEGTELELEAEVVSAGKSLAMLRGVLKRAADGVPVSTCEHTKVAVPSKPQWKL